MPLVLVVALLLGSVLIPARETWRIMRLLRETAQVVEPARLLGARLELGLRAESAALEAYALSGDPTELGRYTTAAADDDRQIATLSDLARTLDPEAVELTAAVQSRVGALREIGRGFVEGRLSRTQLSAAVQSQEASYDQALQEVTRLASYLSAEGSARRDVIRGSEQFGLLVNTLLVIVALAAVLAVGALSYRERRLTVILRRRIEEDAALRGVTLALGTAATAEDVMRLIAEGTTAITNTSGSYIECITAEDPDAVDFVVHDRGELSSLCTRASLAGSLTEAITARGSTGALMEIDSVAGWVAPGPAEREASRAGLIAPMSASGAVFGALVILRDRASAPFGEGVRRQMHTLADLASTALQRITIQAAERRALEEAERRARQQAALREAAESLAAAFTFDEVTQQIARTALEATQAQGAFVEQIAAGTGGAADTVVVRASTGLGVPPLGAVAPFPGSRTEQAIESHEPIFVPDLPHDERPSTGASAAEAGCSAIVVRLGHGSAPIGALFIVNAADAPFRPDDLTRARTFGHLAALAYEKVGLLDEAREGRRALEQVLKSRSRLMRGFSHDVKNPLGAADGYAALLSGGVYGALSAAQAESIERIRGCIRGALGLIDDLHEMARAETGHIVLSLSLVDLAGLVRTSGDEYRAAAEARGLSLMVDVSADPPAVETDPARTRQIVGNLLSNAIKYTTHGSVALRVWRRLPERGAEAEEWAAIEVRDTGPGIPVEKRDAIFEEFIRIGNDETSGAGLGLAISQRLAQALGGRITVESEVGYGSAFTLWLPLRRPEGQDAPVTPAAGPQQSQHEIPSGAHRAARGGGLFSPERPVSSQDGAPSMASPSRPGSI
jgi:signal transduction histidine kinase